MRVRQGSLLRRCGLGLALATAAGACSDQERASGDRLTLNPAELPSLACREPVTSAGECARREDCGHGELCTLDEHASATDREPIALHCGPALGLGAARARCEQGADCETGLCGLAGVCLEPCVDSADCLLGQTCQPVEARLGDEALAPVQACARVAAFPPDVHVRVSDYEAARSGLLNRLPIQGLAATNMVFLKADCARTLRVPRIVDRATRRDIFDWAAQLDGVVQINPSINEGALLPLLLPNNPRLTPSREGYDLGVSVDAETFLQVIVAEREKRGHILDLNVFYLGGGKDASASGLHPGSAEFAEVLSRLSERYAAIGIELGAVREYDVVGSLRDELSVLQVAQSFDASGVLRQELTNLGRVFELSAGVDDGGLNVFVLQKMGPLLGVAGGTPGALGLHGSPLSGVALALDTAGLERADLVLFHELGHMLGLLHTSELDGFEMEPLSDTPACTAEQDSDADGILRGDECSEHGADNLMFWEGGGEGLSPQQIDVLTRALVLR